MKKSVKIIISVLLFALVGTGMFTYSQIAAKASEYRELIEAGEKAVSNGNSEEALKYYEKAIQLVPRKTAAYEKAADTYCEQWKYEEAEKVLETAKRAVKKSEKKRISKKIEELGVSKKAGYEKIYLEFVKKEFIRQKGLASLDKISFQIPSIVDAGSIFSTENMVKENKGVISRYIVDMNKDNVPEMILSYADVLPNLNDQNTGQLVVEIYTIRDGQVVKVEFDENDELPNDMHYEFFYNKCQGNIHVFLNEYEGIVYLNILYALENSIGTLNYDVRIDTYCVGRGGYLSWMMGLSMSDGQYDGYQGLATEIQKSYEILYPLGDWFVDSFESSLGESGTEVFAPYDFDLSEKDSTLTEITRIQASRENGMQSFKYYDYSDLREHIGLSKQSKKVLEKQIQKIGLADIQDFWITYQGDEMFGSADERNMGLLSALEYDCNFDGKDELLVFYLKQELHQEDDWSCSEQNLYIDLYAEKKGKLKLVKTVDVLKPLCRGVPNSVAVIL